MDPQYNSSNEITQEDAWALIKAYFQQHGLVSQQISSFDRFLSYTIQDIIAENSILNIVPEKQYAPGGKSPNDP